MSAALRVSTARAGQQSPQIMIASTAELAGEVSGDVPVERLMITPIGIL